MTMQRRQFLKAVGGTSLLLAAPPLLASCSTATPSRSAGASHTGDTPTTLVGWLAPSEIQSSNGLLEVTQTAQATSWAIDGVSYPARTFSTGVPSVPSETWRVRPGDQIKVELNNRLIDEPTNLHVHGFHVSPEAPSDNVYIDITPGNSYSYRYTLPDNHPPGLYWYHPHRHHYSNEQVFTGMAGAIVIDGLEDEVPWLKDIPQAVVILQSIWVKESEKKIFSDFASGPAPEGFKQTLTVNGLRNPTMGLTQGEPVWLRILNASAMSLARIGMRDHTLNIVAVDGNPLPATKVVNTWDLPPGGRIDAILVAGAPGTYSFGSVEAADLVLPNQKYDVRNNPVLLNENLGFTLNVGPSTRQAKPVPSTLTSKYFVDLSAATPARERVITLAVKFDEAKDEIYHLMDGREYKPDRIDQEPQLDTMEEWRIVNKDPGERRNYLHPMHIHVNPVQVISVNGKSTGEAFYRDTFVVPYLSEVVVRTEFKDFTGEFVSHCHNLSHEDHGMMQNVNVVKKSHDPQVVTADSPDQVRKPPNGVVDSPHGH